MDATLDDISRLVKSSIILREFINGPDKRIRYPSRTLNQNRASHGVENLPSFLQFNIYRDFNLLLHPEPSTCCIYMFSKLARILAETMVDLFWTKAPSVAKCNGPRCFCFPSSVCMLIAKSPTVIASVLMVWIYIHFNGHVRGEALTIMSSSKQFVAFATWWKSQYSEHRARRNPFFCMGSLQQCS